MKEIGTTGIYEYDVTFSSSWGKGNFTVICSETTKGTLDALVLTVISTDLEQVAGQVSSIMGSTSGLSDLKTVAATMSGQFSMIESALSKVGRDIVTQVKDAIASAGALEAVYTQLKNVAKEIKQMSGETGVSMQKLFDVSAEKKQDMVYLMNKTQELKAAMDINQKMIDNVANKPVTQTWYEYKG
jgi:hypothetical protein